MSFTTCLRVVTELAVVFYVPFTPLTCGASINASYVVYNFSCLVVEINGVFT